MTQLFPGKRCHGFFRCEDRKVKSGVGWIPDFSVTPVKVENLIKSFWDWGVLPMK